MISNQLTAYFMTSFAALCAATVPSLASAQAEATKIETSVVVEPQTCEGLLSQFKSMTLSKADARFGAKIPDLKTLCGKMQTMPDCKSVQGTPIFHYEKAAGKAENTKFNSKKILVFSLIHGDEKPAGDVVKYWMERIDTIDPRNSWRIVPVLNPDGLKANTRVNANLIDLNRNFPTKDWTEKAKSYWISDSKKNPRRFPGDVAGSEPELKCALSHLEDFKPDFIVSIHTPLKVLDYDGPKIKPPKFDYLPWRSLGHYPGSLGRYMWFERQVPVLTMELKEDSPKSSSPMEQLQDIIGTLVGLELKGAPDASPKK